MSTTTSSPPAPDLLPQQHLWLAVLDAKPLQLQGLMQVLGWPDHHDIRDLQWVDRQGRTPLMYSTKKDFYECACLLLQARVDVDYRNSNNGGTALHEAVHEKIDRMVKLLLENGASPFIENNSSLTPWDNAILTSYTFAIDHMKRLADFEGVVLIKVWYGGLLRRWKPRQLILTSRINFGTMCNLPQLWIFSSQNPDVPKARLDLYRSTVIQTGNSSATLRLHEAHPHPGSDVIAEANCGGGLCIYLKELKESDSTSASRSKFPELLEALSQASHGSVVTAPRPPAPVRPPPHPDLEPYPQPQQDHEPQPSFKPPSQPEPLPPTAPTLPAPLPPNQPDQPDAQPPQPESLPPTPPSLPTPAPEPNPGLEPPASGHPVPNNPERAQGLLLEVCASGSAEAADDLLAQGADAKKADQEGVTPLSVACIAGHLRVVEVLLKAGAPVNVPEHRGSTPLSLARDRGHHHVVEALLKVSAEQKPVDTSAETKLGDASTEPQPLNASAEPRPVRPQPISVAGIRGHQRLMGLFCQQMGQPQTISEAGRRGHQQLLDHFSRQMAGAGMDGSCSAAEKDNSLVDTSSALESGSNTQVVLPPQAPYEGTGGEQPYNAQVMLHAASSAGDPQFVQRLLELGADPQKADEWGETPLLRACVSGCLPVARSLLQNGARIDKANYCGVSPLFFCCSHGNLPLVKEMLDHSEGSLENASFAGVSPADEARKKNHMEIAHLLEQYEARQPVRTAEAGDSDAQKHQEALRVKQDEVQRQMHSFEELEHAVQETAHVQEHNNTEEVQARLNRQVLEAHKAHDQLKLLQQQLRDIDISSYGSESHSKPGPCSPCDSRVQPPPIPGLRSLHSRQPACAPDGDAAQNSPMTGTPSECTTPAQVHAGSSSDSLHTSGTHSPSMRAMPAQGGLSSSSNCLHTSGTHSPSMRAMPAQGA